MRFRFTTKSESYIPNLQIDPDKAVNPISINQEINQEIQLPGNSTSRNLCNIIRQIVRITINTRK